MSIERIQARLMERGVEDRSRLLHREVKHFQRVRVADSQRGHSVQSKSGHWPKHQCALVYFKQAFCCFLSLQTRQLPQWGIFLFRSLAGPFGLTFQKRVLCVFILYEKVSLQIGTLRSFGKFRMKCLYPEPKTQLRSHSFCLALSFSSWFYKLLILKICVGVPP